jgi:hypothetical protein
VEQQLLELGNGRDLSANLGRLYRLARQCQQRQHQYRQQHAALAPEQQLSAGHGQQAGDRR